MPYTSSSSGSDTSYAPVRNPQEAEVTLAPAERAAALPPNRVPIKDQCKEELRCWLEKSLPEIMADRDADCMRQEKWEATLRGQRFTPAPRRDLSNVSVPMTVSGAVGARARLDEGAFGTLPIVTAEATPASGIAGSEVAKSLAKFLESEILNPEALNGREVGKQIIVETVNYGTAGLKVFREADKVQYLAPATIGGEPVKTVVPGRPRWGFISHHDLIYWNGYGTNTQRMPYVGQQLRKTWTDITTWKALNYYDADEVDKIANLYETNQIPGTDKPATLAEHEIVELYLDWPIDDTNIPAAILVDFHMQGRRIMRVDWNDNYKGRRPIEIVQFDINPDPLRAAGQGVPEKLEGAQDEADAIHNLGIEAGKRAAMFLIGLKYQSHADEELSKSDSVLPGEKYASEDPDKDVVAKPLGDATNALAALQIEDHTWKYIAYILGLDPSKAGMMESGKRVPNQLGMTISREGRVVLAHALSSNARAMTNALYLTTEMYKKYMPKGALVSVVGPEMAEKLLTVVFAPSDLAIRDQFVITFNAQDAATIQESRKQELVVLTQFLMGFYDKLVAYGQLYLQLPPEVRDVMATVIAKLENSVRALLSNVDSISNPDEVIPDVAKMLEGLRDLTLPMAGSPTQPTAGPGGITGGPSDLGGGVT